jgi:hypothetical protein
VTDAQWKLFFETCSAVLGKGHRMMKFSDTWCSWTTFRRLTESDAGYWTAGLPNAEDIAEGHIRDGGVWGQPFQYSEIAHWIVPGKFIADDGTAKSQDIKRLSQTLKAASVPCTLSAGVLEIKVN